MADLDKLNALESMTSEADANGPPTPEQLEAEKEAAEQATAAQAWAQVPLMVGSLLSMFAPELQAVYTPQACANWGERMVPVAEKYGWNGPTNLPEIGLAIATAGFALPTVTVVKAKLAQLRAEKDAAFEAAKQRAMDKGAVPSPITDVGVADGVQP